MGEFLRVSKISEQHMKLFHERVSSVERNFGELCTILSRYSRKIAKLRNKNDELVKVFEQIGNGEISQRSYAENTIKFASTLAMLGDQLHERATRLETNVVFELANYEKICRNVRSDSTGRDSEFLKRRQVEKFRNRKLTRQNFAQMSKTELELLKNAAAASNDLTETGRTRSHDILEDQLDNFERRKLHDFKSIFLNFLSIEIRFHANALELLTLGFNQIASISEADDLEQFQELRTRTNSVFPSYQYNQRATLKKTQSMGSFHERIATKASAKKTTEFVNSPNPIADNPFIRTNFNRKKSASTHLHSFDTKKSYHSDNDEDRISNAEMSLEPRKVNDNDSLDNDSSSERFRIGKSLSSSSMSSIDGIPDFTVKKPKKNHL